MSQSTPFDAALEESKRLYSRYFDCLGRAVERLTGDEDRTPEPPVDPARSIERLGQLAILQRLFDGPVPLDPVRFFFQVGHAPLASSTPTTTGSAARALEIGEPKFDAALQGIADHLESWLGTPAVAESAPAA